MKIYTSNKEAPGWNVIGTIRGEIEPGKTRILHSFFLLFIKLVKVRGKTSCLIIINTLFVLNEFSLGCNPLAWQQLMVPMLIDKPVPSSLTIQSAYLYKSGQSQDTC